MNEATHNVSDLKGKALANEVESMKITLPAILAYQTIYAQVTKAKFDALIAAGFTRQEAFSLCK